MEKRRMGGKFWLIPYEVQDLLDAIDGEGAWKIYRGILRHAIIEEDWTTEDQWVRGKFRMTLPQLLRASDTSQGTYYRIIAQMVETGLIEHSEAGYIIPFYKKKGDVGVTASQMEAMAARLISIEKKLEELAATPRNVEALPQNEGNVPQNEGSVPQNEETGDLPGGKIPQNEAKVPQNEAKVPQNEGGSINLDRVRDPEEASSSTSSNRVIGPQQEAYHEEGGGGGSDAPLSQEVRKRLDAELEKRGLWEAKREEVLDAYDEERIMSNIPGYDEAKKRDPKVTPGLLWYRIERDTAKTQQVRNEAISRGEEEQKEALRREQNTKQREEEAQLTAQEQEETEVEAYKNDLGPEERSELRDRAEKELREIKGVEEGGLITDTLITIKENEIIQREVFQKEAAGSGDDG